MAAILSSNNAVTEKACSAQAVTKDEKSMNRNNGGADIVGNTFNAYIVNGLLRKESFKVFDRKNN